MDDVSLPAPRTADAARAAGLAMLIADQAGAASGRSERTVEIIESREAGEPTRLR